MYYLTVKGHFDAAHYLREYQGKCANLHGHRWEYKLIYQGKELNSLGMLVDFTTIKQRVISVLDKYFDHKCLNEVDPFDKINPTAENLSKIIYNIALVAIVEISVNLDSVELWESPDCSCIYKGEKL